MRVFKKLAFNALLGLLGVFVMSYIFVGDTSDGPLAWAGSNDNVSQWAWSEKMGYISFDCNDPVPGGGAGSCATTGDWGVRVETAPGDNQGAITGYAWSSTMGWISFNRQTCDVDSDPIDTNWKGCFADGAPCTTACLSTNPGAVGTPLTPPYNAGGINYVARYNNGNNQVSGWARILSMGSDGWVKLRKDSSDGGPDYGVTIDSNGKWHGWGWSNNANGIGMGWVSFSDDDCDADDNDKLDVACGSDNSSVAIGDYEVVSTLVYPASITSVEPTEGSQCSSLQVTWSDYTNDDGYRVMRKKTSEDETSWAWVPSGSGCYGTNGILEGGNNGVDSCPDNYGLDTGTSYDYIVRTCTTALCDVTFDSMPASNSTLAVCQIDSSTITNPRNACPNEITLAWATEVDAESYGVYRCDMNESGGTCESNEFIRIAAGGCADPVQPNPWNAQTTCTDIVPDGDESHRMMYKISAYAGGVEGDKSNPAGPFVACPKPPSFIEVLPQ